MASIARRSAPSPTSRSRCSHNFAAQAVIAIENTRLLNELRRTTIHFAAADRNRRGARGHQPLDVRSQRGLRNRAEVGSGLCAADLGVILRFDGAAAVTAPLQLPRRLRFCTAKSFTFPWVRQRLLALALERRTHPHSRLLGRSRIYVSRCSLKCRLSGQISRCRYSRAMQAGRRIHSGGQAVSSPTSRSLWSRPFADQAAIAIENVRLFEAEQQRTAELTESLEQQTATSEVLSVISSSPGELEPVFQSMLANATRICEAQFGGLFLSTADVLASRPRTSVRRRSSTY